MKSMSTLQEQRMMTGLRIRRERILWGLTQEELSHRLGVSTNYLGQIERGNRDLSRKIEDRLCRMFHLDRNELHSIRVPDYGRINEADMIVPHLRTDEIRRMLNSCSEEEIQLCGHVLRALLLFLRKPTESSAESPSAAAGQGLLRALPNLLTSPESLAL